MHLPGKIIVPSWNQDIIPHLLNYKTCPLFHAQTVELGYIPFSGAHSRLKKGYSSLFSRRRSSGYSFWSFLHSPITSLSMNRTRI